MKLIISIISTFLFLGICHFQTIAQDSCSVIVSRLNGVESKFTRTKLDKVKILCDSLSALIPDDCPLGKSFQKVIEGRYKYKKGELDEAEELFKEGLEFAQEANYAKFQKHILDLLSGIEFQRSNYTRAIDILEEALEIPCPKDSMMCFKNNIRLQANMGLYLYRSDKPREALKKYEEVESMFKEYKLDDSVYRMAIFNTVGNIYNDKFLDYQRALNYYQKGFRFCPKKHSAKYIIQASVANGFFALDQLDSAAYYYNHTIDNSDRPSNLIIPYQGLGNIARKKGEKKEAIVYMEKAVETAVSAENVFLINNSKLFLAKALFQDDQNRRASIVLKEISPFYLETEYLDEKLDYQQIDLLNKIALRNTADSKALLNVLNQKDSLNSENNLNALNKSVARYENLLLADSLAQADLLNSRQELQLKNSKLTSFIIGLLAILGGLISWLLYARFIKQKEISQELQIDKADLLAENEELIFEKEELRQINYSLGLQLEKARKSTKKETRGQLELKTLNKLIFIDYEKVLYIQAEDFGVRVFTVDNSIWSSTKLKEIVTVLPESLFKQIYRSTVVHIDKVREVKSSSLTLNNGRELKIGRTYKKMIKEYFTL